MRALTVLMVVAITSWQSTAWGEQLDASSPPPLQRVHRIPSGGVPVTTVTPLPSVTAVEKIAESPKTFVSPPVVTYRQVTPPAPVVSRRYYAYRPMFSLTPKLTNYHLGRGIIGQPKVYVPGQPVRNFFRYISP